MTASYTRRIGLLGLFGLIAGQPLGACGLTTPGIALCQVDAQLVTCRNAMGCPGGALLGSTSVWIYPVLYIRVYGGDPYEGTVNSVTLLNGSRMVRPPWTGPPTLIDPGGAYLCLYNLGTSAQAGLGPMSLTDYGTGDHTVKISLTDSQGGTVTVTAPVARLRPMDDAASFTCGSTHCGR